MEDRANTSTLRDVHGRKLNSMNEFYMLPADAAEHNRLDVQHSMLKSVMGGLTLAPSAIEKALSPRPDGTPPRILDLGTGSGTWAIEMASEFPHAEVIGLDVAPVNPSSKPPVNCTFHLGDCNTWLDDPLHEGTFDVIQARCIVTGVTDYRKLMQHINKALRPGGVYQVIEGRLSCYDQSDPPQPLGLQDVGAPGYSWQHNLVSRAYEAMTARSDQITKLDYFAAWLRDMGPVWEEVGDKSLWTPIGPWDKSSPEKIFQGEAMLRNCFKFTESVQPLLLAHGFSKNDVQLWINNARKELEELPFKQWSKVRSACQDMYIDLNSLPIFDIKVGSSLGGPRDLLEVLYRRLWEAYRRLSYDLFQLPSSECTA